MLLEHFLMLFCGFSQAIFTSLSLSNGIVDYSKPSLTTTHEPALPQHVSMARTEVVRAQVDTPVSVETKARLLLTHEPHPFALQVLLWRPRNNFHYFEQASRPGTAGGTRTARPRLTSQGHSLPRPNFRRPASPEAISIRHSWSTPKPSAQTCSK